MPTPRRPTSRTHGFSDNRRIIWLHDRDIPLHIDRGGSKIMRIQFWAAVAAVGLSASAAPAATCDIHFFPAHRLQSVGEDFDAVHKLDQDLAHYERTAGRPLNWLAPARQLELVGKVSLSMPNAGATVLHEIPLKRSEALAPGPRVTPPPACHIEIMVPQLLMERGGLSSRSLRAFGIVRTYAAGTVQSTYSGFAVAQLPGFRLKQPADTDAATALVELAYRDAIQRLVVQSQFHSKPQ